MSESLRRSAEDLYAHELAALAEHDREARPPKWKLSPRAVVSYLLGGEVGGTTITPKYLGQRRLMEIAVATLATDRALLLLGVPGTAKSCVRASGRGDFGQLALDRPSVPPVPAKRPYATAGTMRVCSPRARATRRWSPHR